MQSHKFGAHQKSQCLTWCERYLMSVHEVSDPQSSCVNAKGGALKINVFILHHLPNPARPALAPRLDQMLCVESTRGSGWRESVSLS